MYFLYWGVGVGVVEFHTQISSTGTFYVIFALFSDNGVSSIDWHRPELHEKQGSPLYEKKCCASRNKRRKTIGPANNSVSLRHPPNLLNFFFSNFFWNPPFSQKSLKDENHIALFCMCLAWNSRFKSSNNLHHQMQRQGYSVQNNWRFYWYFNL